MIDRKPWPEARLDTLRQTQLDQVAAAIGYTTATRRPRR